ncbi:MAG: hypothetical protein ACI89E_001881, partial [Planctomycetota bacterium]
TEHYKSLLRLGSVYGGAGTGATWQRAARMTSSATQAIDDSIQVDSVRWFSPGATIRIRVGENIELAVVRKVSNNGNVKLDRGLQFDYVAYEAEVSVLSRRAVNINTASQDVLRVLIQNLSLRGRNERIAGGEAKVLSQLILESRPFADMEDFLRRLVLPAAGMEELPQDAPVVPDALAAANGAAIIGEWDALALYRNALNANDFELSFSTMPFCFTSNDVYDLSLRAVVNGKSGVERFSALRDETRVVIPQKELKHIWSTQADWDELLRLNREAPYWATGPEATSRTDPTKAQPPSRLLAHFGTFQGKAYIPGAVAEVVASDEYGGGVPEVQHTFPQTESSEGFAQLFHTSVDESADPDLRGRILHFTHDRSDPEGRYLPEATYKTDSNTQRVAWSDPSTFGLARSLNFSCWIKPESHANGHVMDLGGADLSVDRVSLAFEDGDLVLRCLDGAGDHSATAGFKEEAEVHFSLTPDGTGAGLPTGIWNHIEIDVRGSRPDQMSMLVNGLAHGVRNYGMSRLTASISASATSIPLESTEGFPADGGVVRIGDEVIEYTSVSGQALQVDHISTGKLAGFGGRGARRRWVVNSGNDQPMVFPLGHLSGATVQLYGYSLRLESNATSGRGQLQRDLGIFRVGIVDSVIGGTGNEHGDDIAVPDPNFPNGFFSVGKGIIPSTSVTGLVLRSAEAPDDDNADVAGVMAAFNPDGGYACLMQIGAGDSLNGSTIGGYSVIRYSGWAGGTLNIEAWGHQVPLGTSGAQQPEKSFVVEWEAAAASGLMQDVHEYRLFVMPISVPAGGAPASSFQPATESLTQFVQLTEPNAAEFTEWVAYNSYQPFYGGQLVRDNVLALARAHAQATRSDGGGRVTPINPNPPPGSNLPYSAPPPPPPRPANGPLNSPPSSSQFGLGWQATLGTIEDEDYPITRAVREAFQFRGVMRTFSHPHIAGTQVMPVHRAIASPGADLFADGGAASDSGRLGHNDPVVVMGQSPLDVGWPMRIDRAHLSDLEFIVHTWIPGNASQMMSVPGTEVPGGAVDWNVNVWYFTLSESLQAAVLAGSLVPNTSLGEPSDTRVAGRLMRFPSGERPRETQIVTIGSAYDGTGIMAASVDEVIFGDTEFGGGSGASAEEYYRGAQLLLTEDLAIGSTSLPMRVQPRAASIAWGTVGDPQGGYSREFLNGLDSNGGLLRLGSEILAYEDFDADTGDITLATLGRGLLGSVDSTHEVGARISFLDGMRAGILAADVSAAAGLLQLTSTAGFPPEGTVLVGSELIHYTRLESGALAMPRLSDEAGKMDARGSGMFRGRYGTSAESHPAGEPVILFPMRYWDRWTDQAEGPELAYFGLEIAQPAAFWRSFSWQEGSVGTAGVRMGVLMRTDQSVPWDADPKVTEGLEVFYEGDLRSNWVGEQTSHVEWRVFVDYQPGAFDLNTGQGHGWRTSPRLKNFLVDYVGPASVLRSVDR